MNSVFTYGQELVHIELSRILVTCINIENFSINFVCVSIKIKVFPDTMVSLATVAPNLWKKAMEIKMEAVKDRSNYIL